ncbi:MAG: triose-phosphate isomerase [Desulfitobacteriaceae bacterium]|nr:triose-phosphate isomerase [Desulfitobacteriaceae bacterium]MDD4345618.1 triose-phosphate isomerase [Desulfitobacteriaceae bacterium]MDD4400435.1 triose-phosphate isomerase [Desulfitobacteriaceae bacterium]
MDKKRRPVIAGNWKMYKTTSEARNYAQSLVGLVGEISELDIVVCAPFTSLPVLKEELKDTIVHLGAQNMCWADEGAFTGEISPRMLLDVACTYVIIGHSERREHFRETDEDIARKVKAAIASGLKPILCVGENLSQRQEGKALAVVRAQLQHDLLELAADDLRKITIAYEPIWAIGTGKTASSKDAQEMCAAMRSTLSGISGSIAEKILILYGGSVKPDNIAELMAQPDIDGALVGGASLTAEGFAQLIKNACIA